MLIYSCHFDVTAFVSSDVSLVFVLVFLCGLPKAIVLERKTLSGYYPHVLLTPTLFADMLWFFLIIVGHSLNCCNSYNTITICILCSIRMLYMYGK